MNATRQRVQLIPKGFSRFLNKATPQFNWEPEHLKEIRRHLDRVTTGEISRLLIFAPPRHGKSEQTTIHYPAYRLLTDQREKVIVAAYNRELASQFSRQTRRIVSRFGFKFAGDSNKQYEWQSIYGGGLTAVGVGSGVTGKGASLLLIDDPVKSRAEAESPAYRNRVLDWWRSDLLTRLHPGAAVVIIMTRWVATDLAGQLLEEQKEGGTQWTVLSLPALAEDNDPLGRQPGGALWPERYGEADFERIKKAIGSYAFSALYQQRPSPRSGGFFRADWLPVSTSDLPVGVACRAYDTAATPGGGDFTAGVRIVRYGDRYRITHVTRGQWSPAQRRTIQRQTAEIDGLQTVIHLAQDPGAAGVDQVQHDQANLAGFATVTARPTGSKEVRAMPFAAACEAGLVELERGDWNRAFVDELCSFPTGQHDDQVDAAADAFNYLARANAPVWYA